MQHPAIFGIGLGGLDMSSSQPQRSIVDLASLERVLWPGIGKVQHHGRILQMKSTETRYKI